MYQEHGLQLKLWLEARRRRRSGSEHFQGAPLDNNIVTAASGRVQKSVDPIRPGIIDCRT
jgi:hypothetical protein